MSTFYPQVGNYLLTQVPYTTSVMFDNVTIDIPSGMRFSFPRRAGGVSGYPTGPLGRFSIAHSMVTDAEIVQLRTFFNSQRAMWGRFAVLDPQGNLVFNSEDLSDPSWISSSILPTSAAVLGPFSQMDGWSCLSSSSSGGLSTYIGPSSGGMNNFMVCVSVWAMATSPGQGIFIGMADDNTSTTRGTFQGLSTNTWVRVSYRQPLWNSGGFKMLIGGDGNWGAGEVIDLFGPQAAPNKGESGYARTPGMYGYHPVCRFNTDVFKVDIVGPNQNQVNLPCEEIWP